MILRSTFWSILAISAASPVWADTLVVSSNANSGPGSLRAALELVQGNGAASRIIVDTTGAIEISETLIYAGADPLSIIGTGQTIKTDQNITLLAVTHGADLDVARLTFQGPGGFDITARDPQRFGKGIFIALPENQTGTVSLSLDQVSVFGVAGHGIHVSDCDLADDCGGGGGAGGGSAAGISLDLRDVTVQNVGNGRFDADGLRVDERGVGSIEARILSSRFVGVGADGVELDEGQQGSVVAFVANTRFEDNGIYCHPGVLRAYLPDPEEAEFEKGKRGMANIPGLMAGSPDEACVEREVDLFEDGSVKAYEVSIDVDDGFDVDEAGPGGIDVTLVNVAVTGNLDEGLDLDEEDAGSIRLRILGGDYSENGDEGIKVSEEDAGSIDATVLDASAISNGGTGLVFEEEDAGDVTIRALGITTQGNDDSDDTGIEIDEDDAGKGRALIVGSEIADGIDANGIEMTHR